jgi:hypothetical protein
LKKALADVASPLNKSHAEILKWQTGAEKIGQAVREKMWDAAAGMFFNGDAQLL